MTINWRIVPFSILLATSVFAQPDAPMSGWQTYVDNGGYYKISYPPGWQVLTKGNALVITSPGGPDERGVFGITPRAEGVTINDAVDKEFSDPNRASDLQKSASRIAGIPATKVWGSKKGDPNIRVVEYYVQSGTQQFYILFQAPHSAMTQFSPVFNSMISSMKFLK
jgi:hypothetical protein